MTVLLSASTGPEWLATLGARLCAYTASKRGAGEHLALARRKRPAQARASMRRKERLQLCFQPPVHSGTGHPADGADGAGRVRRAGIFRRSASVAEGPG